MTPVDPWMIQGGIPPDPDHMLLMKCCYSGCYVTDRDEPLTVTGCVGKMATFCRKHLTELQGVPVPQPEYGPSGGELDR